MKNSLGILTLAAIVALVATTIQIEIKRSHRSYKGDNLMTPAMRVQYAFSQFPSQLFDPTPMSPPQVFIPFNCTIEAYRWCQHTLQGKTPFTVKACLRTHMNELSHMCHSELMATGF